MIPLAGVTVLAGPGNTVRLIANPTLFDNPLPKTNIHVIVMQQPLPAYIETAIGDVPVGGDFNLLALQIEYAFSDTLSLVATKYGYINAILIASKSFQAPASHRQAVFASQ